LAFIERRENHQLTFPYPEESTVFFVFIKTMNRDEFLRIIGDYSLRWIIDVRAVPRLDTIAGSHISAFQLFEKSKASYVDLFGKLGIRSYRSADSNPAVRGLAVSDILKNSERKGPYLFLFDNEDVFETADRLLPNMIKPVIGKRARFARLGHS
jgi:hypothetical protein